MAYVDPLLSDAVPEYTSNLDTHTWAGFYVAESIEQEGYKRTLRSGKLAKSCSAKTAKIFERRK